MNANRWHERPSRSSKLLLHLPPSGAAPSVPSSSEESRLPLAGTPQRREVRLPGSARTSSDGGQTFDTGTAGCCTGEGTLPSLHPMSRCTLGQSVCTWVRSLSCSRYAPLSTFCGPETKSSYATRVRWVPVPWPRYVDVFSTPLCSLRRIQESSLVLAAQEFRLRGPSQGLSRLV